MKIEGSKIEMNQMSNNRIKKVVISTVSIAFTILLFGLFATHTHSKNNITNQVQASSLTIPKKMRGTWKSKPIYAFETKHIKKNMAVPAMKMKVTAKKVRWHFIGYVPAPYNRKKHTIKLVSKQNGQPVLKGHGPFRDDNYLQMSGKKLILSYHGGFNQFTKVAK